MANFGSQIRSGNDVLMDANGTINFTATSKQAAEKLETLSGKSLALQIARR